MFSFVNKIWLIIGSDVKLQGYSFKKSLYICEKVWIINTYLTKFV